MGPPPLSRRIVLGGAASLGAALLLPSPSWAAGAYGVLYYGWAQDIEDTLDGMDAVIDAVSASEALKLEVVRDGSGRFGVIGRYDLDAAAAAALAASHDAILRERAGADDTLATPIALPGVQRVYNVSYGLGPNQDALEARYADVARLLGPELAKRLVVERTGAGNYALVYKRYGDLEGTRAVAVRHAAVLRRHGLDASFIQERNHPIVFDGTSDADPAPVPDVEPAVVEAPAEPPAGATEDGTLATQGTTSLQSEINEAVQALRRRGLVASDEQTSWMVYDLEADAAVAAINATVPRQAASMIKPFVMLAFFHEAKRGRFIYGPKCTSLFEAMIQRSSNTATNWAIAEVGGPAAVQAILDEHYGALFRQTAVVETIASGGRTYRNKASAEDYTRYLGALWRDELPSSAEQKRLLNLPGRDRLYSGAPSIPVGTTVYNKTGSTSRLCGDMGILVARKADGSPFPYIVVGIIEKGGRASSYGQWIGSRGAVIRQISDLTYRRLREERGLA